MASTYAGVREGITEYSKTFTIDRQRYHRGRIHDHFYSTTYRHLETTIHK